MSSKYELSSNSEDIIDHRCSLCQTKGKKVEANTFCADCQDYYCDSCGDLIHGAPALRNHKLITTDDAEYGEKLPSVPTSRCKRHRSKIIDMYCLHHDQVGCVTCIRVDHNSCDVFDIPEFVQTNNNIHLEFVQAMQDLENQLKESLNGFQLEQEQLLREKDKVINQINTIRAKLEDTIRKKAELAIRKAEKMFHKLNKEFSDKIITLDDEIEKVRKMNDDIEASIYNTPEVFVLSKITKECIPEAERVNDEMKQVLINHRFLFFPGTEYDTILSNNETSLGDVKITPFIYSFSKTEDVDTTGKYLRQHFIYDACNTSEGSVYFTDSKKNLLLRVCNTNMVVVEHIKLDDSPHGVCCISDNEIAVCTGKTIQIFNTENHLQFTRSINISHNSFGLSCHNGMLYVADSRVVYKYDMDGSLQKEYNANPEGNDVSSDIVNIVVNPLNNYIHVTDYINNTVITMDQEGFVVNIVKDVISGPWGICLDNYGQVFVSGYYSNNIIQLNSDGKFIKTVINEEASGSRGLCFDKTCERLYVGNRWDKDITVFNAEVSFNALDYD